MCESRGSIFTLVLVMSTTTVIRVIFDTTAEIEVSFQTNGRIVDGGSMKVEIVI